jgi:hypothetical protein
VLAIIAAVVWRSQLFTVSAPGERPRPLALRTPAERPEVRFDVVLPAVPVGLQHLRSGGRALIVHYWAPWERHGAGQIAALDSLLRTPEAAGVSVVVVCFDPFPSVARFVARNRVRAAVLLDHERLLRAALPCPSVPYTYGIDASGRTAIAQSGEVDWLADSTRAALARLAGERDERAPALKAAL